MEKLAKKIEVKIYSGRGFTRFGIPTIGRATGPGIRPTLGAEWLIFWRQH